MNKKCQYCGRIGHQHFHVENQRWACKAIAPCFNRLLARMRKAEEAVKALKSADDQMSNVCFNWSQHAGATIDTRNAQMLRALYQGWGRGEKGGAVTIAEREAAEMAELERTTCARCSRRCTPDRGGLCRECRTDQRAFDRDALDLCTGRIGCQCTDCRLRRDAWARGW